MHDQRKSKSQGLNEILEEIDSAKERNDYQAIVRLCGIAISRQPTIRVVVERGISHHFLKNYSLAINDYEYAFNIVKDDYLNLQLKAFLSEEIRKCQTSLIEQLNESIGNYVLLESANILTEEKWKNQEDDLSRSREQTESLKAAVEKLKERTRILEEKNQNLLFELKEKENEIQVLRNEQASNQLFSAPTNSKEEKEEEQEAKNTAESEEKKKKELENNSKKEVDLLLMSPPSSHTSPRASSRANGSASPSHNDSSFFANNNSQAVKPSPINTAPTVDKNKNNKRKLEKPTGRRQQPGRLAKFTSKTTDYRSLGNGDVKKEDSKRPRRTNGI